MDNRTIAHLQIVKYIADNEIDLNVFTKEERGAILAQIEKEFKKPYNPNKLDRFRIINILKKLRIEVPNHLKKHL